MSQKSRSKAGKCHRKDVQKPHLFLGGCSVLLRLLRCGSFSRLQSKRVTACPGKKLQPSLVAAPCAFIIIIITIIVITIITIIIIITIIVIVMSQEPER